MKGKAFVQASEHNVYAILSVRGVIEFMATNQATNDNQPLLIQRGSTKHLWSFAHFIEDLITFLVFAATVVLVAGPFGYLVYGSLQSDSPRTPGAVFTFDNWREVYLSTAFLTPFLSTALLAATIAVLAVLLGALLAWIVARTDVAWRSHLPILLVVPMMISTLVTTLAWIALAAPNAGFINVGARALFGIKTIFDIYSFSGISLVLVLHFTSFAFLAIYGALRSIDTSLEEASRLLGASPLKTAFGMTLPLVWPTIVSSLLMVFVFVAENFSVPTILGSPIGFDTLSSKIYSKMYFEPPDPPLAATAGTMLLWITLIGTMWQRRVIHHSRRFVTIGNKGSRHSVTRLGGWRYVATAFCLLYFGLAVVLPYLALVLGSLLKFITPNLNLGSLTFSNYVMLFDVRNLLPVRNSLLLSVGGGLIATLFYVFLTYLIRRTRGRFGGFIDYLTTAPTSIPGLVLGVGLLWEFVSFPLPIYGTMIVLVVAYFTRYLGYGVRQSSAAIVQVSDELVEAARVSGASPLRSFKDITLPLLKNSMLSLWTMLFIFFFMEVSVTVLLFTPQTITLPMLLWTEMGSGYITRAFAVGVVQSTVILLILYFANRMFGTLRHTVND